MTRRIREGSPNPLGLVPDARGANVAIFSRHATAIELCLFDEADREVERIRLPERTGDVFHGHVEGVGPGARYGLRAHGPYAPAEGHRFNPAKLLVDPHARLLDRRFRLESTMFGYWRDREDRAPEPTDSAAAMPKAVVTAPRGPGTARPLAGWGETILYELHVRGFTRRHPDVPEAIRGTFAGLAHPAAIEHLVKLGVTSVELMPCAAWIEERHLASLGLTNYWGYNPAALMAPEPRLAPGGWSEIRATVEALAAAGIETIVDVVLNHSGEGDALGPTLSLRGLDNATYYRLPPEDPSRYIDDSGCGNTLALDRAPVVRLAMDGLRVWAREAGVHGFRFDLATAMGRRRDGFDPEAPLLAAIAQDPELSHLKLIAEPWDIGPGGYQVGNFPTGWGEWNDRFRDDVRRFWRGDPHQLGRLATRLAGSADLFGRRRPPSRGINFITAHDGFALADLVAHETKRNEANGEDNRDGSNENFSWNWGCEGPSDDPAILAARAADQRALVATLLFARGTPMLAMGAELGHSQGGNNNCYAQDSALSWLDWSGADPALLAFVREAVALRRSTPLLRRDAVLEEGHVAWLAPDGAAMTPAEWDSGEAGSLTMLLGSPGERVGVLVHRGHAPCRFALPPAAPWRAWTVLLDSASGEGRPITGRELDMAARAVAVVAERPDRSAAPGVSAETLARLSRAAGIHDDWWTVDGVRHQVGDDTRRHLLAAMRLGAGSEGEARESLERLAEARERRPLPPVVVIRDGEQAALPLALGERDLSTPVWVRIVSEDGGETRVRALPDALAVEHGEDVAGRPLRRTALALPPLPLGRYTAVREDAPDQPCRLTVAPGRAYLPPAIARGERLFGISTQLYSVRREGDQGIGDFATLGELARHAAEAGAAAVGINPLHGLFPHARERASPYSPSDRRFLDPIYLDVGPLDGVPTSGTIDYPAVWAAKDAALRARFAHEPAQPPADPRLATFAAFNALSRRFGATPWPEWPSELRDPASPAVRRFAEEHAGEVAYQVFLQRLCDSQLAAAAERTAHLSFGLYRDLAVGAAPDGAEAWASQALLARGVSIGAPPDPLGPEGQVWNLPPFDPHALASAGLDPFAELLAANMAHAGALRLDHAMGLARLFWVPDGAAGKDGSYVSYPLAELLGEAALASVRARCAIVAEALGTVPDGFAETLSGAGMLSYRVALLEREGSGFRAPAAFPPLSLACVSNHDLPTFAGWWQGADIAERAALGLESDPAGAAAGRERDKAALLAGLGAKGSAASPPAEVSEEVHARVAAAPSAVVLVQAEDLALEERAVNMPGTDVERPNWRRRLGPTVEGLFAGTGGATLARVREARRAGEPPQGEAVAPGAGG